MHPVLWPPCGSTGEHQYNIRLCRSDFVRFEILTALRDHGESPRFLPCSLEHSYSEGFVMSHRDNKTSTGVSGRRIPMKVIVLSLSR